MFQAGRTLCVRSAVYAAAPPAMGRAGVLFPFHVGYAYASGACVGSDYYAYIRMSPSFCGYSFFLQFLPESAQQGGTLGGTQAGCVTGVNSPLRQI